MNDPLTCARVWLSSPCWSARDYVHPALVLGALDGGPLPLNTRRWLEREAQRRARGGALRQSAHWARRLLEYFDERQRAAS